MALVAGAQVAVSSVTAGSAVAATPSVAGSSAAGTFVATSPHRQVDTRHNVGATTLGANATRSVQITGSTVPTGVRSVVLNVTVTAPSAGGFLTVWGDGSRPTASNLNFSRGQTVPNLVVAPVTASGKVNFYNGSLGHLDVVADIQGYYLPGTPTVPGAFKGVTPKRLLDTRSGLGGAVLGGTSTRALTVTGGSVPAGVKAVVLNVTVTGPTAGGFITVYADGGTRPTASNLNFRAAQTVPNLVVAPVSAGGKVDFYNGSTGKTQLVADIEGYYVGGSASLAGAFVPTEPTRLLDTRTGEALAPQATRSREVTLPGSPVPSGVSAVVLNVTVTAPGAGGYITAWAGGTRPTASNLNFVRGQTVPNLVVVPVSGSDTVSFYNGSTASAQLVVDVAGYYYNTPAPVSSVSAAPSRTAVSLSWDNPTTVNFDQVIIRRASGTTAPATPNAGTAVATTDGGAESFGDTGLSPGGTYSYSLFAADAGGSFRAARTVTTTTVSASAKPAISERGSTSVTADALPTVQINGVVWSEATVGNTVYAGGSFTKATPAGVALGGAGTVTRNNLLAFDITTGNLVTTFVPNLNSQIKAVAASPDGTRIYVGGQFTTANGVTRSRVAAYSTATGALITSFAPVANSNVNAIAATNSTVYLGGSFTTVNNVRRTHLAAVTAATGALTAWAPSATGGNVQALVMTPDKTEVIAGGSFTATNGSGVATGVAALDATSGQLLPYGVNAVVKNGGEHSAILSLSTDGTFIYGTGFVYGGAGYLEGTFSVSPNNGAVNWIEDCHGDSYGSFGTGGLVYVVSHAHDCFNVGSFPDAQPRVPHHALQWTAKAMGTIGHNTAGTYHDFQGQPAPSQVNWYPDMANGTYTGQSQAAWSITGNSRYIALGGEFPTVNGKAQNGLVRFAVPGAVTPKQGPRLSGTNFVPSVSKASSTSARISWTSDWDRDNENLTYQVIRNGDKAHPVSTQAKTSQWFNRPGMTATDSGLKAGTTYTYQVIASDRDGNVAASNTVSIKM